MKLVCKLCQHKQDGDHLAVRCEGCGEGRCMTFAPTTEGWKPGEPMVGPSRVAITGGSRAAMRGPQQEPLEVTRERRAAFEEARRGYPLEQARAMALLRVPVQCGLCGGVKPDCAVCRGVATVPTAELAARLAPKRRRR